jgi:hypothetical protein
MIEPIDVVIALILTCVPTGFLVFSMLNAS